MLSDLSRMEVIWLAIGLIGQGLFTGRFLVQWICSERVKRSVIPMAFWYLSLAGGLVLLSYALYRQDPVFILGQLIGAFIYLRNIYFSLRERRYQDVNT
ncbi:MAG: lipid A biosynthesis protein [Gammaproteobacteria bacterium]|nr:lipid A biosynthesis protein [Gammaproteobacteria bacterium]